MRRCLTAPKIIFPKYWNIMESSKISSKYNFFLSNFRIKKSRTSNLKRISVIRERGIPCYKCFHLVVLFENLKIFFSQLLKYRKIKTTYLPTLKLFYPEFHRSSPQEVFLKNCYLEVSRKFTGEHLYRGAISIKLQSSFNP